MFETIFMNEIIDISARFDTDFVSFREIWLVDSYFSISSSLNFQTNKKASPIFLFAAPPYLLTIP